MSKARKRSQAGLDEPELFADQDFDLDGFIDTMENESDRRHRRDHQKPSRQRLDDWREAKWLRDQLQDWEDWDGND